jgi:hypothetical protein
MDLGNVLTHILIVLVAAKLAAEVAERLGIPVVVAEILAGVDVHAAVIRGERGLVHDRFEVTDARGGKLTEGIKHRVRTILAGQERTRRGRRHRRARDRHTTETSG